MSDIGKCSICDAITPGAGYDKCGLHMVARAPLEVLCASCQAPRKAHPFDGAIPARHCTGFKEPRGPAGTPTAHAMGVLAEPPHQGKPDRLDGKTHPVERERSDPLPPGKPAGDCKMCGHPPEWHSPPMSDCGAPSSECLCVVPQDWLAPGTVCPCHHVWRVHGSNGCSGYVGNVLCECKLAAPLPPPAEVGARFRTDPKPKGKPDRLDGKTHPVEPPWAPPGMKEHRQFVRDSEPKLVNVAITEEQFNDLVKPLHKTVKDALDSKPTNPKDAISSGKWPAHLWPTTATVAGSLAMLHGAMKYGRANWRACGARSSVYYDALMRHVMAWWEGEDNCPDSGVPHLGHALACLAILIDAGAADKLNDDRAYPGGYGRLTVELTKLIAQLRARDQKPVHYTRETPPVAMIGGEAVEVNRP